VENVAVVLKSMSLFFLVIMAGSPRGRRESIWIYKAICWIGPWAMLDVFLLSVLVALASPAGPHCC